DDTGGAAQSEEDGVRTSEYINARNIVAVPWNVAEEVVARIVGGRESADAGIRIGIVEVSEFGNVSLGAVAVCVGKITAWSDHLGDNRVSQDRLVVIGTKVGEEFLSQHRNGGAHIGEISPNLRAGERARGLIAAIFFTR